MIFRKSQLAAEAHICPFFVGTIPFEDDFANESIYSTMRDLAPDLEYTMQSCRWLEKEINCTENISPMMTDDGLTFTFNALNSHDIYTNE